MLGVDMQQWADWSIFGICCLLFAWFEKFYADNLMEGERTFGNLLLHGFVSSLIFVVIIAVFNVVYVKWIDVNYYQKIIDLAKDEFIKRNVPEDVAKQALEESKKYMKPYLLVISVFLSNIILTTIANIIGSLIFKKDKSPNF